MERVALGESVEIRRRDQPIAVLKPVESNKKGNRPRPNFKKRLQTIYGDQVLPQTASDLLSEERGDR